MIIYNKSIIRSEPLLISNSLTNKKGRGKGSTRKQQKSKNIKCLSKNNKEFLKALGYKLKK